MAVKLYFCICAVVVFVPARVSCAAGSLCTTPNGESAICTDLTDCSILLQAASSKDPGSIKFFNASRCGDFMVCCGTVPNFTSEPFCTTPNGESAICTHLTNCDILLQAASSKDPSSIEFFKASSCGDFLVCCGRVGNFTSPPEVKPSLSTVHKQDRNTSKESQKDIIKPELLASRKICGYQFSDDYFHENETTTTLDEFPWLVYISLYKQTNEDFNETYELRCAGVLISSRYALTAAECDALHFTTVEIGQHSRFKDHECKEDYVNYFGKVQTACNNHSSIEVEEKVKSNNGILLIRFAEKITFNDYIRPICLPYVESDRPKVGDQLTSSGWGDVTLEESNVQTKKRVQHVLKEPQRDDLVYVSSTNYTNCFGDEGGPLMAVRGRLRQWSVEAIIPPYFCLRNTPARRINPETIDWIFDNIRP